MRPFATVALGATFLLAGCGGGGGGGVQSTPTPVTTAPTTGTTTTGTGTGTSGTTTPATIPTGINYDDAEYARSGAARAASAITAYNAGATGAGVRVAIVDSGLIDTGGEFTGRIDAASRALTGSATYADTDGHGTAVAAVALAGRNGRQIEGVAFGATVMALKADSSGSCGTTDGCAFNTATLANAIDYATQNGARVINLSLGGATATAGFRRAIDRATAAGVIIVIAAGNDGSADPDPLALVAGDAIGRGLVVIAGSHDAAGAISSFSDRAGSYAAYYLAALGERVRAFDHESTAYLYSGTSFSAPAIAGAIALLQQAFPNLTPAQVVNLLYASATDAGAAGLDATFGHGLLNLTRAFQPMGTTSLAGTSATVSLTGNAVLSPAMGDARMAALARSIITDGYGRAFAIDLTGTVSRLAATRPLRQALVGTITRDAGYGGMAVRLTVAHDAMGQPWVGLAQRGLTRDRVRDRALAGTAVIRMGQAATVGFAFAGGGSALAPALDGAGEPGAFLAARAPGDTPGFDGRAAVAAGAGLRRGRLQLTGTTERGTLLRLPGEGGADRRYTAATLRLARTAGRLRLAAGVGLLDEAASVLGARFEPMLGGRGAATTFIDADAALALGDGWTMRGRWRRGWTDPRTGGALTGGTLRHDALAVDLGRVAGAVRYAVRYAMPTRVSGGGLALALPTGYDYATARATYTPTSLALTPDGRERDVEATLGLQAGPGWLDANLYRRREPGNIAALPDDRGAALRYALAF